MKKSTPVVTPKLSHKNLINQSTQESQESNNGIIALIIIIAIIVFGITFFPAFLS